MAETKASARSSRESQSHDNQTRRKPWRPVRSLETPTPPEGYTYRLIRESMLGQEDRANVSRRLREGVVYNEGLLLAKIPNETVEERRAYYAGKSQEAKDALDNTMFNETRGDSRYVKYDPQRDTNVTFGRR